MAEEDLECVRRLLWDSVASYEGLVLCGASSGVIKLWNPLSRTDAGGELREAWLRKHRNLTLDYGKARVNKRLGSKQPSRSQQDKSHADIQTASFFLDDLLENGTPRGKKDAATALSNLCIYQGNKGRAVRAGIVPALVKMLSDSSSHRMVDEALTILSVLASNLDAKAVIVKANTLPALIGILQTGQARNRENAAAILLSLCKRDNEKLVAIGRLGAVVPLMDLTKNGTERGKGKATSLLEILRKACQ
ncbi:hypothetical protein Bca4012_051669 [Brassica carinata]